MTNCKKNHAHSNNGCFTNVLQRFICAGNLPTHPSPDEIILTNDTKRRDEVVQSPRLNSLVDSKSATRDRVQLHVEDGCNDNTPGIIARLMGLDSLPRKSTSNEALFRSKSWNSLHFLPDFDPAKAAFHRRARTSSASFREQGHAFLVKIDENEEINGVKIMEFEKGHVDLKQKKERIRMNVEISKENEFKKNRKDSWNTNKMYQERYYNSSRNSRLRKKEGAVGDNKSREKFVSESRKLVYKEKNSNVKVVGSTVSSKRKLQVDHKQDVYDALQNDALSKSPVSVLDHHHEFNSPPKEDARRITSNSRRKPSQRIENFNDMPPQGPKHIQQSKSIENDEKANKSSSRHKPLKADTEVAEYFVELLGQIRILAGEQFEEDFKVIAPNYEAFKDHYMEQLCQDCGQELLDFVLDEVVGELTVSL